MPYNCFGDLYRREVVDRLKELGCDINSVHEFNLILEEMGFQNHSLNGWITTEEGTKYTIFRDPVYNVDAWKPEIVDVVYAYLKRTGRV